MCYVGGQFDDLLHLPAVLPANQLPYGTGEEQNMEVMRVYDDLCKQLRKLTELPLVLNTIQGVSPCFRFTEVSVLNYVFTFCFMFSYFIHFYLTKLFSIIAENVAKFCTMHFVFSMLVQL